METNTINHKCLNVRYNEEVGKLERTTRRMCRCAWKTIGKKIDLWFLRQAIVSHDIALTSTMSLKRLHISEASKFISEVNQVSNTRTQ